MAIRPQPKSFVCFAAQRWQASKVSRLLLDECADLRAELITIHGLHSDGDGDGLFSARQQSRTVELRGAAENMEALIASLPRKASDGQDGMDTQKSG